MERLTIRNSDGSYSQPTHTTFEAMFYKLAEFEDFMEANKFENIKELQNALNGKFEGFFDEKHKIWIKTVEDSTKCKKENQTLKGNWANLREFVGHERICVDDGFQEVYDAYGCVLDKMQELEGGDGRNKQ